MQSFIKYVTHPIMTVLQLINYSAIDSNFLYVISTFKKNNDAFINANVIQFKFCWFYELIKIIINYFIQYANDY